MMGTQKGTIGCPLRPACLDKSDPSKKLEKIIMPQNVNINLFLNMQTNEITILRMIEGEIGTLSGLWGQANLLRYRPEEFQEKGWDIILEIIKNMPSFDPSDKSEIARMTPAQQRKFYKVHKSVSLYVYSAGEVHLWPSRKVNESGGSVGQEKIVLTPPVTNQIFWEKIMDAFERAD